MAAAVPSAAFASDRLHAVLAMDREQRPQADAGGPTEIQGTRWRGASRSLRSMQNWLAPIGSATSDTPSYELRTLRARSRDAGRNYPIARAALQRSRTAIVGTGLVCRPSVDHETLGITAHEGEGYNRILRTEFERWAENPLECDFEGDQDFYGLQGLTLLSAMSSGDVLALTPARRRSGGSFDLKLQLVEADRVSNPDDGGDSPELVEGVRIVDSEAVGYHVRSTHPGDRLSSAIPEWRYYPAYGVETGRRRAILVWNDKERPGQVRGVPFLAPILEPLKQLERFSGAELMAAVLSAMITVFIERTGDETDENGSPIGAFAEGALLPGQAAPAVPQLALGNGAILDLAPGESANAFNPSRPNANFDPFFMAILKQIGAAIEIPLDVLLLQFNSSYSAARAAMLEAWRMFMGRRWMLTTQFCQPVYGLVVDELVASGRVRLPGYADPARRHAWTRALWMGPARGSMDEEKEARAAKTRIEIGVSNEAMETAAMNGEDWSTVIQQRAREIAYRKDLGITTAQLAAATVKRDDAEENTDARNNNEDGTP